MQFSFDHIQLAREAEPVEGRHIYSQPILDVILAALLNPSFLSSARNQPLLNNEDVATLANSCLPEEAVVRAVKFYEADFDTSTHALFYLKQKGVGERVIEAMLLKTRSSAVSVDDQSGSPQTAFVDSVLRSEKSRGAA